MDISGTKIQGPRTHISEGKKWSQDSEGKADERRKTEKKEKKIKKNIKKKVILVRRCANLCGVVSLPKRILLSNHSTQYTNSLRRHLSTCVQCANILNTVHKLTFVATWIDVCKYVQYSLLTHFYCHVLERTGWNTPIVMRKLTFVVNWANVWLHIQGSTLTRNFGS